MIKDMPHVTVEQVLALRQAAIDLETELNKLKNPWTDLREGLPPLILGHCVNGYVKSPRILIEYVFDGNIFISEGYYFEYHGKNQVDLKAGWINTFDDTVQAIRWMPIPGGDSC